MSSHSAMNCGGHQIISIVKGVGKLSKYIIDNEKLETLMKPVKNKKIAMICIAGPSRMGKSFILSFMLRFLSNNKEIDWIGCGSTPLKGFKWKTGVEPETIGIWFSDPFVLQKSNGEEIAVILMDTQGVFDEESSQRDWSTIVGLSLLSSSCLIFNLMNNLQEDILLNLDSFLQYGLLAAKSESNNKAFQNLVFLIRDWNSPTQYKYGETGGKQFLERKLEIKETSTETSIKIRKMLHQCFEEISCYLMPDPGDKAKEDEKFIGSVEQLSAKFVENMKTFIENLLNPEEITSKLINNKLISGQDLCQYLKTYVEVFNSDELPKPVDIVEATAKASDLILISILKEKYLNEIRALLQIQTFISRKNLDLLHKNMHKAIILEFKNSKKSSNNEIINDLLNILQSKLISEYDIIYKENEMTREKVVNNALDESCAQFQKEINKMLDKNFFDNFTLDELLRKHKKSVVIEFEKIFGNEDKHLFEAYSLRLTNLLENCESVGKSVNQKRMADAEISNTNAMKQSLELYNKIMKEFLDKKVFIDKNEFNKKEKETDILAKNYFKINFVLGYKKYMESEFDESLNQKKSDFKSIYKLKNNNIIKDTQEKVKNALKEYTKNMDEMIENIESINELNGKHANAKNLIVIDFLNCCNYKNDEFLDSFLKNLEDGIDKQLKNYKTKFNEERIKDFHEMLINDCASEYIQAMDTFLSQNYIYIDKELDVIHEINKENVIDKYNSISKPRSTLVDTNNYMLELNSTISQELEKFKEINKSKRESFDSNVGNYIKDYMTRFEEKIEIVIKAVDSENELVIQHNLIRAEMIEEFIKLNPYQDIIQFEPFVQKLKENFDSTLNDNKQVLEFELKNKEISYRVLISKVNVFYKQEMDKYYQKTSFISFENLEKYNETVTELTTKRFESERDNLDYERYRNMIKKSIIVLFNKIKEDNYMNAPTYPAIGIDLGTTNSCVAYYKPGKNGGNVIVIPNESGKNTTPSVVAILDNEEIVGEIAKKGAAVEPRNTIFVAKRLIGRAFSDESVQIDMKLWSYNVIDDGNNNPKISVKVKGKDETYFPEQISAKVIKKMKNIAEKHLQCKVTNAVITVPAYFNDAQKEATKDAGAIAGLNVLKIINEPTAAAIAYKLNRNEERDKRKVLIYDFGGGTFDVVVLDIDGREIKVLAVGGDNHLGGDDFDSNIVKYCSEEFTRQTGHKVTKGTHKGNKALSRLRSQCEEHKCNLSLVDSTIISIDTFFNGEDLNIVLTKEKFIQLNENLFIKSMDLVEQTLNDAQIDNSEIDDIVLVGGSTRIPRIQELLSNMFGGKPLNYKINPDEAVAIGAAVQAAILNGDKAQELNHLKVSDVCPMSLGVKVIGRYMSVIVPRNSTVPQKFLKHYDTTTDYQTSVDVVVYEGEDEIVDNNRELGKFTLTGIPSALKGEQKLIVMFEINDEGILNVKGKIDSTGGEQEIEIKEIKTRLSDQELQKIIDEENK